MRVLGYILRWSFYLYVAALLFLTLHSFKKISLDLPTLLLGIEIDKVIHFLMYLPFSFTFFLTFNTLLERFSKKGSILTIFTSGIILSTVTETLQLFTKYREFEVLDLFANYLGVSIGTLLLIIVLKFSKDDRISRLQ